MTGQVAVKTAVGTCGAPTPRNMCVTCGEFEPHACVLAIDAPRRRDCQNPPGLACGSISAHSGGCRGLACVHAYNAYQRHVTRMKAYGRWAPFTDPAPVIAHVAALTSAGMSVHAIALIAGLAPSRVRELALPECAEKRRAIRPATAAAILAVTEGQVPPGKLLPAAGSRRRLQALSVAGWPMTELAPALGMNVEVLRRLTRSGTQRVSIRTHEAVRELYERLWDTPGPSARVRKLSVARGWSPAMAWDDDEIDNPAATPHESTGQLSREERTAAVLEDSEELVRGQDLTLDLAAERLGRSRNTLEQLRLRHGLRSPGAAA